MGHCHRFPLSPIVACPSLACASPSAARTSPSPTHPASPSNLTPLYFSAAASSCLPQCCLAPLKRSHRLPPFSLAYKPDRCRLFAEHTIATCRSSSSLSLSLSVPPFLLLCFPLLPPPPPSRPVWFGLIVPCPISCCRRQMFSVHIAPATARLHSRHMGREAWGPGQYITMPGAIKHRTTRYARRTQRPLGSGNQWQPVGGNSGTVPDLHQ